MTQRIDVPAPGGAYPIHLGAGLLGRAGDLLTEAGLARGPVAVVTNAAVARHHLAPLVSSLEAAGYAPAVCEVPDGEEHKRLETVAALYPRLLAAGLDRRGAVVALGGGVVGDLAGFAAATYLRGVPLVQAPTTLLAMVDSSVGGKTGVDLPEGKNLVGAFKQPALVLIDPDALATLPDVELRCGLAETIKHALIADPALFARLEAGGSPKDELDLLAAAVAVKVAVVTEDPFEQGRRAVLNLGHTFGHALEQASGYALRHGEAVAVGMLAAGHLAQALGRFDAAEHDRLEALLGQVGLPLFATGLDLARVEAAMGADKKRVGRRLRFVIPEAIGRVALVEDPSPKLVSEALARVLRS